LFANESNPAYQEYFEKYIIPAIKSGNSSVIQYRQSGRHGEIEQTLQLAYYPVYARSYLPLAPDEFGRGVNISRELTYIVGVANYDKALTEPFQEVEEDVTRDRERVRAIYIALMAIVSSLFVLYTCMVSTPACFASLTCSAHFFNI